MKQVAAIFIVSVVVLAAIVIYFQVGGTVEGNAPNFTLTDTDGNSLSLSDFEGKVVVLDLMATGCEPCKQEIPHLKEVQQHYGDDVIILSISVGWGGDTKQGLATFKQERGCTWRFAIDTDDIATKYDAMTIPKLVTIDKNKNIRFTHVGVIPSS
ncbi:MAG: TlpA family protein disulfide reductase, partial [Candidatus Hadarchaeaceae archaeon]